MGVVSRVLHFLYDFVVGDDPRIAVAVVTVAAVGATLVATTSIGSTAVAIGVAAAVIAGFAAAIVRDARSLR